MKKNLLQGAAGALLVLALFVAGQFAYNRYQEFVVMREVVAQILQAAQQQQQPAPPMALPAPEGQ